MRRYILQRDRVSLISFAVAPLKLWRGAIALYLLKYMHTDVLRSKVESFIKRFEGNPEVGQS